VLLDVLWREFPLTLLFNDVLLPALGMDLIEVLEVDVLILFSIGVVGESLVGVLGDESLSNEVSPSSFLDKLSPLLLLFCEALLCLFSLILTAV